MSKEDILAACKKHYDLWSDDCSGFVRAVAKELGYSLSGNANALMDQLEKNWTEVDRATAVELAKAGTLVIAGLKSSEQNPPRSHGHVVIVVDGALYHGKYPPVWCGSIGSAQSKGNKTVGEVWRKTDRDAVRYYQPPAQ
jgi:cell wall-associated NlpC family hydrolase